MSQGLHKWQRNSAEELYNEANGTHDLYLYKPCSEHTHTHAHAHTHTHTHTHTYIHLYAHAH